MKYLLALCFVFTVKVSMAQNIVDSFANTVCKCIQENNHLNDSGIINFCFSNAVQQIKGLPKNNEKLQKIFEAVFDKMQSTCSSFVDLYNKMKPNKSDWEVIDGNLPTKLDSVECRKILSYKTLSYLEGDGDTTYFTLGNGYWTDSFEGGKYHSKCAANWTSPSDLELEFLKSDYPPRMKTSKKGEKFTYRLIDKTDSYYVVTAHYGTIWCKFKVYYK
jgi:hypothetical protein